MDLNSLMERIRGFQPAMVIVTGHRLGIFRRIGAGEATAGELAADLGFATTRGVTKLLDALVALELLHKAAGRYRNGETARRHLSGHGVEDRCVALDHYGELMTIWSRLEESVQSGRSCRRDEEHLTSGALERNAVFIGAMAQIGRGNARVIAESLDLSPYRMLIDIGGGPGVYAEEFLRRNPGLKALVADLPLTIQTARPLVAGGAFADRIGFLAFDAYADGQEWPEGFDLALVSNVLHMEGAENNRKLLAGIFRAMEPGGMVILHEKIIDPDRTAPLDAALFAINMLVNTERGDCYTLAEMAAWLQEAGFVDIRPVACFGHPSVITGRK